MTQPKSSSYVLFVLSFLKFSLENSNVAKTVFENEVGKRNSEIRKFIVFSTIREIQFKSFAQLNDNNFDVTGDRTRMPIGAKSSLTPTIRCSSNSILIHHLEWSKPGFVNLEQTNHKESLQKKCRTT